MWGFHNQWWFGEPCWFSLLSNLKSAIHENILEQVKHSSGDLWVILQLAGCKFDSSFFLSHVNVPWGKALYPKLPICQSAYLWVQMWLWWSVWLEKYYISPVHFPALKLYEDASSFSCRTCLASNVIWPEDNLWSMNYCQDEDEKHQSQQCFLSWPQWCSNSCKISLAKN